MAFAWGTGCWIPRTPDVAFSPPPHLAAGLRDRVQAPESVPLLEGAGTQPVAAARGAGAATMGAPPPAVGPCRSHLSLLPAGITATRTRSGPDTTVGGLPAVAGDRP